MSSPTGPITNTFSSFLLSARRSPWYKVLAYSSLVTGDVNLITPGGVRNLLRAIKPSPRDGVPERYTFAIGE